MFKTNNKQMIGKHLSDLITNSEYKSDRQFGIAYLALRYGAVNHDDIPNMQNRICQIKKGNKGVQIEDLPIFSEFLGVSIEDILSAGTALAPASNRKSNYSIAFSKDSAEWEAYVNRDDKLFLNPDEYNKTAIDYALEAGNYPFLKYLMDKGYIWFVGDDKKEYALGFGAGTSIERRQIGYIDVLDCRMKEQDNLRFRMIALAIEAKDFSMLDKLHARELPLLYTISPRHHLTLKDTQLPSSSNVRSMLESIAASENEAISYFFDEFETDDAINGLKSTFIFPYAGQVLDLLVKSKRTQESKRFLEKSIDHNKRVQKQLLKLINNSTTSCKELNANLNPELYDDDYFKREALRDYYFYSNNPPTTGFLAYYMPFYTKGAAGFITNVINVTSSSNDTEVQFLIDELKKTYNTFINQFKTKEA